MKKYQICGFNFLSTNRDKETNILTGTKQQSKTDFYIACFDGFSFFEYNNKYYIAKYPKIRKLNSYHKEEIRKFCGGGPKAGEYGLIMGALGVIVECDSKTYYKHYFSEYIHNLKEKDFKLFQN